MTCTCSARTATPSASRSSTRSRDWDGGALRVRELDGAGAAGGARQGESGRADGGRGRCTVYRPDIGGLLPVYVADRYEGIEARTFAQCSEVEVARYVAANVAAVAEVLALTGAHVALANHLVMGPVILARALDGAIPYAVKVHGSALEYTVKPQPERFLGPAREGLEGASAVLVGSRHTAESLWRALGDAELPRRTRLGPPGVDVERFAPRDPEQAAAGLRALAARMRAEAVASPGRGGDEKGASDGEGGDGFARDAGAAASALARLDPHRDALVAFVGKLIVSKGVDLLLAAWPLVLERVPHARLVIVGFGAYRDGLERLRAALIDGELETAREIALAGTGAGGRAPAGASSAPSARVPGRACGRRARSLPAGGARARRATAHDRAPRPHELADLLPACEAVVVPSTFPEAFGMVAAEAAACGALPVSAAHSGLAEVSDRARARGSRVGRRLAVVRDRRSRCPVPRRGAHRLAAGGPRDALAHARRAGFDGARALVLAGRGTRRDRRCAGRAGHAARAIGALPASVVRRRARCCSAHRCFG